MLFESLCEDCQPALLHKLVQLLTLADGVQGHFTL